MRCFASLAFLSVVVVVVGSACVEAPHAPTRPLGVPSTAAWAGGSDGGAWIDCWRTPELEDRFDCKVFDQSARIMKKARFRLLDVDAAGVFHPAAEPRKVMQYTAWDGCRVQLDGRVLAVDADVSCAGVVCTGHC